MAAKDRPPSFQFYPRDFMADPPVQALTWEQRGRYLWSLCCCWEQGAYGVAPEDQWRRWMRYGPAAWLRVRHLFADLYTRHPDEIWENSRMRSERDHQIAKRNSASIGGNLSAWKRGEITEQTLSERLAELGLSVRAIREQIESVRPTLASAVASAVAPEKLESKAAAAPRQLQPPAQEQVNGTPHRTPPKNTKPDLAMIAEKAKALGAAKVSEIIGIAWGWHKLGVCYPPLVAKLVETYVARAGKIANPYAYFNAQSEAFQDMHAEMMGRIREAEGEAFKKLDGKVAGRAMVRELASAQERDRCRDPEPTP